MLKRNKKNAHGKPSKKFVIFALILYFTLFLFGLLMLFLIRNSTEGATENWLVKSFISIGTYIMEKVKNLSGISKIIVSILIVFVPTAFSWTIFLFFYMAERSLHKSFLDDLDDTYDAAQKTALEFAQSDPYTITFDSDGNGHIHGGGPSHVFTFTGFFKVLLNIILFFLTPIIFPFDAIRWLITHR